MTEKVDLYVRLLGETPLGRILHGMQDCGVIEEVIQDYLQDFVHTVYHAGCGEEQQVSIVLVYLKQITRSQGHLL